MPVPPSACTSPWSGRSRSPAAPAISACARCFPRCPARKLRSLTMTFGRASVDGRRVLITGAARGIGAATARRLVRDGARVALVGLEPELLERVASDCGDAPWWECDVSDRGGLEAVVESAAAELGGL